MSPTATVGRNTFGDVTHVRDANLQTTTTTFDTMGRPTSVTLPSYTPPGGSPSPPTSSTTYNALGLPETTTDPLGHVTTSAYDKYGRVVTVTAPDPDGGGPKSGTGLDVDATAATASSLEPPTRPGQHQRHLRRARPAGHRHRVGADRSAARRSTSPPTWATTMPAT